MPLGKSLSELDRQHRELCRKLVYPKLVESLKTGDLERAKSHAGFLRSGFRLPYPYEAQNEAAQSAIRKAESILWEAQQRGTDEGYR